MTLAELLAIEKIESEKAPVTQNSSSALHNIRL